MKLYTEILKKSWNITRHHTVLWLLGIFAALWVGKGIETELNSVRFFASDNSPLNPAFWDMNRWDVFFDEFNIVGSAGSVWLFATVVCVLFLLVMGMSMLSYTGMIDAFAQFSQKEKTAERYRLRDVLDAGKKHLWAVLAINLLGKLSQFILIAIALFPLFASTDLSTLTLVWVLVGLLISIPLSICITIMTRYASNAAVLENADVATALRRGYTLFGKNVGVSIELAALLFIAFVALVMIALPVASAILTLPSLLLLLADAPSLFGLPWTYLHDRLYLFVLVVLSYTLSVLFSVWNIGSWTLLFQELQKGIRLSKTHRWINKKKKSEPINSVDNS